MNQSQPDFSYLGITSSIAGDASFSNLSELAAAAVNLALGVALAVSFIALVYSGIKYVMSRGDVKATEEAKKALTYSIVAFGLAAGAFTLMYVIIDALGADVGSDTILFTDPPSNGGGGGGGGRPPEYQPF